MNPLASHDLAGVRLPDLDPLWELNSPTSRLEEVGRRAPALRDRILASGTVEEVHTCDLTTLPYPLRYGLLNGTWLPYPFLWMRHRMQVVRYRQGGGSRILLVNPTDVVAARETPFFARLRRRTGEFLALNVLSRLHGEVLDHLERLAIDPGEVDAITFDHLHTQDLRRLLGGDNPWLPRARLLVQASELSAVRALHPLQRSWYIEAALGGVDTARITILEGDHLLGDGVALVRTPGHTWGNHTICLNAASGLFTISENGVCVDSYVPRASRIPGLAAHSRATGEEVILNGNTLEGSLDQYTSMILERTLAHDPENSSPFPRCFPSSELIAHPLAPGLYPTFSIGSIPP